MNWLSPIFLTFLFLGWSFPALGSPQENCFWTHVVEAMDLNYSRRSLYQDLTEKYSLKRRVKWVSSDLVWMELALLPVAAYQDSVDREFEKSYLCPSLIEMSKTPPIQKELNPPEYYFLPPPEGYFKNAKKMIRQAIGKADWQELEESAHWILLSLKIHPQHLCLFRHFVESIKRGAQVAQFRESEMIGGSVEDLTRFRDHVSSFLNLHVNGLGVAIWIDQLAVPLQNEGIQILCNDVPPIPDFSF